MQQFHKFINYVMLYNLSDHDQQRSSRFSPTVKPEAPMQLYAPDDGKGGARNTLSHT
jgi:hypothetical protein